MHKIFSLLALIIFSGSFLYSQNILSQDYNTPNIINVDTECNFTEWHLENGVSSEIGIPICNRNYVDNNYYFQFQIPASGNAKLSVEFSEQVEFGLATYYYNQGTLEELKCDVFSSEDGFITIAENQDLALIDIIVQLWIITPNIASVDICVYEIESLEPEVKLAVFPDMFTPQQLVEDTLVTGCLEAYNVTYNGSNQSIGYFNQGLPGLDFATGIVLSTGDVADAPGPNTSGSTGTNTSSGSDPHLQALVPGYTVNDATVLEFDFVPASDVLQFEYVFGSEEYPEFVNSSYNDVFGFFLTGTNPNGTDYNYTNIALIPGTSMPVTIDNVNISTNSQYYVDNTGGANIEYDGYTVTLTATADVVMCEEYHIKLAVGDCGDPNYDSAVFLKAGSFTSGESYTMQAVSANASALEFYEGCEVFLIFTRTPDTDINQDVPVELIITGTASNGVDYTEIPQNFIIPAGQESDTVVIEAVADGITEGAESIIFSFVNGCPCSAGSSAVDTVYIVDEFEIEAELTNSGPICVGDEATLNISFITDGDPSEFSYVWSTTDSNVDELTVSPDVTTTYEVTVSYPCDEFVVSTTLEVVYPPEPDLGPDFEQIGLSAPLNSNMPAGNTGFWTFIGGDGTAEIVSPDSPQTTVNVDAFGDYTFVWTETNLPPNCTGTDTITISFYHVPTTSIYHPPIDCFSDTIPITYTGNGYEWGTYEWDFGDGIIVSGTHWGPYEVYWEVPGNQEVTLTITELGVTVDTTIIIYYPPPIEYVFNYEDDPCYQSCNGSAEINVTGGTPPYTYHWGSSTNVLNNLCVGDYGVYISDANGCAIDQIQFTIEQPPLMTFDTVYHNLDCYNDNSGWATVTADGGTPPYQYIWSDGFNGNHYPDMSAGIYQVSIYDDHGCHLFEQFNIQEPDLLQVVVAPGMSICEHQTINVAAQQAGGTAPYTYYWDGGSGFNQGPSSFSITPHEDTTLSVYVVDEHGCVSNTESIEFIVSPEMSYTLDIEHVSCYDACDGRAEVTIEGGIPPYSYSWSSNTNINNNLCAGVYTLTVTDAIGCQISTYFTITQPDELTYIVESQDATCSYSDDGSANILVAGGTLPYTYQWSNLSSTPDINATPGTYTVTVTDAHNCRVEASATIGSPQPLYVQTHNDKTICIDGQTTIGAQHSGGTGYATYYWQGTDGSEYNQHMAMVSPLETTRYTVTVTDDNACTASSYMDVIVRDSLRIEGIITNTPSICQGESAQIELLATGGSGQYIIRNQFGQIVPSPFTVNPIETTTYNLSLEDNCGTPSVSGSITINVIPLPEVSFTSDILNGCPNTSIAFTDLTPVSDAEYKWNFGDGRFANIQNPIHMYRDSGKYTVSLTVTDSHGCSASYSVSEMIEIYPKPTVNFTVKPEIASIVDPLIAFESTTDNSMFLFWYYGDGDSSINVTRPMHMYNATGEYEVVLIAENEHGCTGSAYRTVMIEGEYTIYAPDAFSPNGDGVNDCFRICGQGIDPYEFDLKIFDRWGNQVFETDHYDTDVKCNSCSSDSWDGTRGSRMKGDDYMPSGLYYWQLQYKEIGGIGHKISGKVRLIR